MWERHLSQLRKCDKLNSNVYSSDESVDLVEDSVDSKVDGTRKDDSASNNVERDESNQASGSNCSEGGRPSSSSLIKNRPVRIRKSPDRLWY
ncbi:hypothetical protein QE152_g9020 [Popillia japonica]|uniref:Uncharacterized protein n=1 Tax=Popillia japonica TaxID=7064 RepID=A0AAW1LW42_POPJA